jgi:endonuclease YncB( thermonuclease family)
MKYKTVIICALAFFLLSCNHAEQRKFISLLLHTSEPVTTGKTRREMLQFKKGEEYTVKVIGVSDGDTFTGLTADNRQVRCRIYGIDAPEKNQDFGNRSKQTLSDFIFNREVTIKIRDKDRYQRAIVWVCTPDGKDVSAEMLKSGMAWHYKQYSKDRDYAELENEARQRKTGLWAGNNPIAPWEFRRKK